VLAANRPSAQLLGLDAHYLYWAEAAGRKGAEGSETLQRVRRQGGGPETLAELPTGVIYPAGFAATDRAIYVADGHDSDPASSRIVAISTAEPHRVTTVVARARGLDGFVVAGDRYPGRSTMLSQIGGFRVRNAAGGAFPARTALAAAAAFVLASCNAVVPIGGTGGSAPGPLDSGFTGGGSGGRGTGGNTLGAGGAGTGGSPEPGAVWMRAARSALPA
jgi:hypothetical protein